MNPDELNEITRNAELDQLMSGLESMAKSVGIYFAALTERGFSRAEAMQLAMNWQTATLAGVWANRDRSNG